MFDLLIGRDVWNARGLGNRTISAVYPGNRLMAMKVRTFVGHVAQFFGRAA
jgi:hypothetical protein